MDNMQQRGIPSMLGYCTGQTQSAPKHKGSGTQSVRESNQRSLLNSQQSSPQKRSKSPNRCFWAWVLEKSTVI